jgi:hypothetical protein
MNCYNTTEIKTNFHHRQKKDYHITLNIGQSQYQIQ